ncbi:hypothetical protein PNOK_0144800 [Pyrrhoderma noxium]|uniref:Blue (type 1) copper domain-containing protein n=1 Tax=Pyrrhoderma noxium TaxID=2282107 RepID=A0A286UXQ3_9AGAM|nr:hypothetical protein PNOK_0144800 [Pyrrhoderma noxium]
MRFTTTTVSLVLPAFVAAQYGYGGGIGPATTSSSVAAAATAPPSTPGHVNIDVAFQGTFTFNPANVSAPNGTIVTFFFPNAGLQHSVTQSSFANPCTPLAANETTGAPAGFSSGFQENTQFSINITNDQIPIWFHCAMPLHCGMGMVGSINANESSPNNFTAFKAAALAIGSNEQTETIGSAVLVGPGASASVAPTNTAGTSSGSSGSTSSAIQTVAPVLVSLFSLGLAISFSL